MKKIFKNPIFTFILGAILFGSIGVGATALYNASEIGFTPSDTNWKVNNLNDAINDLYNNKTGKVNFVKIGTNNTLDDRTFDVSNYDGYENFTIDNFWMRNLGLYVDSGKTTGNSNVQSEVIYDPQTGIVTVPKSASYWTVSSGAKQLYITYDIYLIY